MFWQEYVIYDQFNTGVILSRHLYWSAVFKKFNNMYICYLHKVSRCIG